MEEKSGGLFNWIRRTSFLRFFVSWLISIVIFALIYWIIALFSGSIVLENQAILFSIEGLFRSIYASFLIATIFGIVKIGHFGLLSVIVYIQMAFTIIVLFILIDKLLQKYVAPDYHASTSQDKKINTVMLMMSIFRQDADRLMHEFKSKGSGHINLKEIEAMIDGLYVAMLDVEKLVSIKNIHRHKIKNIQYLMLTENIDDSLEKLSILIEFLDKHKIEWKDKSIEFWLRYILETADKIAASVDTSEIKNPKVIIAIENIKDYTEKIEDKL